MNDLLKQMADDLRAVRRLMERQAERSDLRRIVAGLVQRGVVTRRDADKALGKINGEGKDN